MLAGSTATANEVIARSEPSKSPIVPTREPKSSRADTKANVMKQQKCFRFVSITLLSVACRHSMPGPAHNASTSGSANNASTVEPTNPGAEASSGLPKTCSAQGKFCAPPGDFVERLCASKYPDLAIVWFAKGTPWTRRYVKPPAIEPRNTIGGPSSETKLVKGEEVLVLRQQGGSDAKATGAVDYDVLRWDGTCATLSELEMADSAPSQPKNALIVWRFLDVHIQTALFKDPAVERAQLAVTKACKGSTSAACTHAVHKLSAEVASAVRRGIDLPARTRTP
jgi:hypothetical protein